MGHYANNVLICIVYSMQWFIQFFFCIYKDILNLQFHVCTCMYVCMYVCMYFVFESNFDLRIIALNANTCVI